MTRRGVAIVGTEVCALLLSLQPDCHQRIA
jgi:hypothetical protein